ncbi:MAG: hypothetical protein SV775_17445 [Thermodesulfobacteriota bacterium]|nr:hypothetical protein [Thermodesulfobacteriota bacterium]
MKKTAGYNGANSHLPAIVLVFPMFALLIASVGPAYSFVTQTAIVATAAADYSSGAHSIISVDPVGGPRTVQNDLLPTISDVSVAAHENYFYRIERFNADNVTKFDIKAPDTPIWQYSTMDAGETQSSNPHGLVFVNSEKAYIFRSGSTRAWIINPSTTNQEGFKIGELDLSPYADSDGLPEMESGVIVSGKLFIILKRVDRNDNWAPTNTAYIAVFDVATDLEIDTKIPNEDGVLGIPLEIKNPSAIQYLQENNTIYVQGLGRYGNSWAGTNPEYTGGIVSIDPVTYQTAMVLDDGNDASHPFGNIAGLAIVSETKGYFVGYEDWGDNTLYSFNPATGIVGNAVSGLENKSLAGLESGVYSDMNAMLWVCNQTDARIDIIDTTDDTVDESISTNLNPQTVSFCIETDTLPELNMNVTVSGAIVTFSWNSVAGAAGYTLLFTPYPAFDYTCSIDMGIQTNATLYLWAGNATFLVAVQAYDNAGISVFSNVEFLDLR